MKRCPTCDKTFDDNLKFCQIDGTSLVEDAPVDPYKTMVASKEEIAAAMAAMSAADEIKVPEEPVLEIPSSIDANVTQVVSEAELRAEMEKISSVDNQVIDVPPIPDSIAPELPKFNEPSLSPPSFGESAPPPSPFSGGADAKPDDVPFTTTSSSPIPSPFGDPKPPSMEPSTPFEHEFSAPEEPIPPTPQFAEPEPAYNPFEHSAPMASEPLAQAELTAPAAPDTDMQNPQNFGNAAPASGSVNQTLPIVSLVFGILSLCCYISPLTGLIALITGFMGMKNVNNDPSQYGGKTLALVGMILGGLFLLIGLVYWVFLLFFGGMSMMMEMAR